MNTETSSSNKDYKQYLNDLEGTLDEYMVKKAPALPKGVKDVLVAIAPFFTILGVIFGLIGVLAIFGLGTVAVPFMALSGRGISLLSIISAIILVVSVYFQARAIPGLQSRRRDGWTYLYYSTILGVLSNLVHLDIVGAIIGGLIGFYFLFQIKEYYK